MNFKSKKWLSLLIISFLIFSNPMTVSKINTVYATDEKYEAYFQLEGSFGFNLYVRPKGSTELGTIVYCFNHSKTPPYLDDNAPSYNGPVAYTKVTGFSDILKGKMANPRIQDEDELEKKLLAVIANGYPMNSSNLQGTLSNESFRKVTQIAVWYFTDSKNINSNQLANPYTSGLLTAEEETVVKNLIASTYNGADNMKLDFYIADNSKYQNLLAANIIPVVIEKINMVFSKQNINGVELEGAEIEIRNADDTETVVEWISDGTEKSILLDPDTYIFREKNAPAGYLKVNDITFKVNRHGDVIILNQNDTDTVVAEKNKLTVIDQAEPATQDPDEPATQDPDEPATQDPDEPATQDPDEPATQDPDEPATQDPDEPANPAPEEPANPAPEEPVNPTPVEPVNPAPVEPVNPTPVEPVNPTPVEPVSPTPAEPVNPAPEEPLNPTPAERVKLASIKPVNPISDEPVSPIPDEPVSPDSVEPVNPIPDEPVSPDSVEPVNPIPDEPVKLASIEPANPTTEEPVDPTPKIPVNPVPVVLENVVTEVQVVNDEDKRNVGAQDIKWKKELPKTGYTTDQYRLVGMLLISLTLILAYFTNRKRHSA